MNTEGILKKSLDSISNDFARVDEIAQYNTEKVISAFQNNRIALRHFAGTEGYGYDDVGRDTLSRVIAEIFEAEEGILSPNIVSGTHALTLALYGVLRPNDEMLSISGNVYDTLYTVINCGNGSLREFGIKYSQIDLQNGRFDFDAIKDYLTTHNPKLVFIQRSRGYDWREALSVKDIAQAIEFVRHISPNSIIMVDNCYGEFIAEHEPTYYGADLIAGSMIKNPGGGIAPTGGYIVGKKKYVDLVAGRLTSPSIGMEVGSYACGYRLFYQGLFLAPHITAQAVKTSMLFSAVFQQLGYDCLPKVGGNFNDIICAVKIGNPGKLEQLCATIQRVSPIDSFLTPEPWDMPGYEDQVIMAAGCFVQGSSIELSSDAPMREPYILYIQGGLTQEHGIYAVKECLKTLSKF